MASPSMDANAVLNDAGLEQSLAGYAHSHWTWVRFGSVNPRQRVSRSAYLSDCSQDAHVGQTLAGTGLACLTKQVDQGWSDNARVT